MAARGAADALLAVSGSVGGATSVPFVAGMYEAGQIKEIRDYCELDVLNTYLVYLRYALLSGKTSRPTDMSKR